MKKLKGNSKRRLWVAVGVMIIAALMDMLDGSIVNVALPTIQKSLSASPTALEWVVSGYMLTFAATLITAGRLGDRFGRRKLFLLGVVGFGTASLLSGMSHSADQLIIFRLIQGFMAAILVPQVLATFRAVFDSRDRVAVFGIYGAAAGLAAALGVILGGLLTQVNLFGLEWRTIFLVNVPVAVILFIISLIVIPETRKDNAGRMDWAGSVILAAALVGIVYPLLEGRQHNWPMSYLLLLLGGILAIGVLAITESRREKRGIMPLIKTKQFVIPAFSVGMLVQLLFSTALQGFSIIFILWLQLGHQFSPLKAGMTLVAFSAGAIITAPSAGKYAIKYGKRVLAFGALLMALGTALTAVPAYFTVTSLNPWLFVPGLIIAGAGLGLLVVPLVNVVLSVVPSKIAGGASGIFSTAQQLGGAIGVAIVGGIFFSHVQANNFMDAFKVAVPFVIAAYLLAGIFTVFLPNGAVGDEELAEVA